MLKKFIKWVFREEFMEAHKKIDQKIIEVNALMMDTRYEYQRMRHFIDVSVDVNEPNRPSKSWAAISIQGQKMDYVRFLDMSDMEIHQISAFLRQFERGKIDARPDIRSWIFKHKDL